MDPEVLTANGQVVLRCQTTKPADRCARRQFSVDSQLQAQATGETHVGHFRPSWKRKPFLTFVFRIWSRRMFIWSQWCAWCSGFRRKVATAPSFLVAKPRVPVTKCDYAPGFFEPWAMTQGFCGVHIGIICIRQGTKNLRESLSLEQEHFCQS